MTIHTHTLFRVYASAGWLDVRAAYVHGVAGSVMLTHDLTHDGLITQAIYFNCMISHHTAVG